MAPKGPSQAPGPAKTDFSRARRRVFWGSGSSLRALAPLGRAEPWRVSRPKGRSIEKGGLRESPLGKEALKSGAKGRAAHKSGAPKAKKRSLRLRFFVNKEFGWLGMARGVHWAACRGGRLALGLPGPGVLAPGARPAQGARAQESGRLWPWASPSPKCRKGRLRGRAASGLALVR
jgi:hypothetical protein